MYFAKEKQMTEQNQEDSGREEEGAPLVVVTSEMIAAGVAELREKAFGQRLDDVVHDVFISMVVASPLFDELGRLREQRLVVSQAESCDRGG